MTPPFERAEQKLFQMDGLIEGLRANRDYLKSLNGEDGEDIEEEEDDDDEDSEDGDEDEDGDDDGGAEDEEEDGDDEDDEDNDGIVMASDDFDALLNNFDLWINGFTKIRNSLYRELADLDDRITDAVSTIQDYISRMS